ncbi:MAG: hypothetical protein KDE56_29210 [Anaerolineales bacterium]|nr:hypothetical protein [Anaerolineales bacterium]
MNQNSNLYKYVSLTGEVKTIYKQDRSAMPIDQYWGAYVSSYANPNDIDEYIQAMQMRVLSELKEYEEDEC